MGMSMARAGTRHIMSDRLVGDTGGTVTRTMRTIGGESISGTRHDGMNRQAMQMMIYDLAALAAPTSLICMC